MNKLDNFLDLYTLYINITILMKNIDLYKYIYFIF